MVTVGGAIANDVHGKNHHRFGCFSHHVLEFELLRSDGTRLDCSLQKNAEWFRATVGGLGLTGLITRVKLQLRQVAGVSIRGHSQRFANLDEFFELSRSTDDAYEYTVAWIDCTASGAATGRGVFICGNHAQGPAAELTSKPIPLRVPFTPPVSLINGLSMGMLNQLYLRRAKSRRDAIWHYRSFLYPLDAIRDWNRIYGPRGFFQYQCVIPEGYAPDSIRRMLLTIREYRAGSFLSVLKTFGPTASLGMLSFARPGTTLALDFPNHGKRTMQLLEALDEITRSAGGAVYPAKDARMSSRSFQEYYPAWRTFATYVDPKFSSSFWRRVTEGSA
jgi:FAD/FMN-containing dehydrogenase